MMTHVEDFLHVITPINVRHHHASFRHQVGRGSCHIPAKGDPASQGRLDLTVHLQQQWTQYKGKLWVRLGVLNVSAPAAAANTDSICCTG